MADVVFVDASAWVALGSRRDSHHGDAVPVYSRLLDQDVPMVTTNWTAYEALTLLKARAGLTDTREWWDVLNDPDIVELVHVTPDLEQLGLELLFGYRDKLWGVVDCVRLVVMEQLGCTHSFAFDEHFVEASKQRGFQNIP